MTNAKIAHRDAARTKRRAIAGLTEPAGEFAVVEGADGVVTGDGSFLGTLPASEPFVTASGSEGESEEEILGEVKDAAVIAAEELEEHRDGDGVVPEPVTVGDPTEPQPLLGEKVAADSTADDGDINVSDLTDEHPDIASDGEKALTAEGVEVVEATEDKNSPAPIVPAADNSTPFDAPKDRK